MLPYISWPAGFDIDPLKVTGYLLNTNGKSPAKAQWWIARGFDRARPHELMAALYQHTSALNFRGIAIRQPYWGHSLVFEGQIGTPNGAVAIVRSVWQVDYNTPAGLTGIARLITAHRI